MPVDSLLRALVDPFTDRGSRTWIGALLVMALIAAVMRKHRRAWTLQGVWQVIRHPSTQLDAQLYVGGQLIGLLRGGASLVSAWWLATHLVRRLDALLGVPELPFLQAGAISSGAVSALYAVTLFVCWDASRWVVHWLGHRVPALWALHQVHHSAEVLTPLTFHRIHPVESLIYELRGSLTTAAVAGMFFWIFRERAVDVELLGVSAFGLICNVTMGNLRHSHVWIRFPRWLERWLVSPAQHQLHHSADPAEHHCNMGTWLAVWDRMAGTLRLSADRPPERFGLPEAERNHGDDLLSAWFGPFRRLLPVAAGVSVLALQVVGGPARADETSSPDTGADEAESGGESEDSEEEGAPPEGWDDLPGATIIVTDEGGTRVAGSAHAVDEAALERAELDDIERIVSHIPAVTTRGEDGFGLRPNIGIRGANSDRSAKVTLLEDGVLFAPAPYAAPAAYYFPMSTRLVGVEVFKGPAATRYGPQTVGGAINLRTRSVPRSHDWATDVSAGLHGALKAHAWGAAAGEGGGVLVEGVHLRSAGFKELDSGGPTGFSRSEINARSRWAPNATHELQLKLGYGIETSHETYLGLTLEDWQDTPYRRYAASALGHMHWDRTQAELAWGVVGAVDVRTVVYHHYLTRAWTKLNGFADGPDLHTLLQEAPTTGQGAVYLGILRGEQDSAGQLLQIGTNDRTFHSGGVQTRARWETGAERWSSTLEGGARVHIDDVARVHTEAPHEMTGGELVSAGTGAETTLDSQASAHALSVHLHEELRLGQLYLLPGGRVEVIRTAREDVGEDSEPPLTRVATLPGMAVMVGLGEWTDAFVGLHRGFSPVAPGQPEEVEPELSWNTELGARFSQGDRHAELVGFLSDYVNLTGQCTLAGGCLGDDIDRQFNGGKVWVYGVEAVAGDALLGPGSLTIPLEISGAIIRSRFRTAFDSDFPQFGDVEAGDSLPYVPQHQGAASVGLRHPSFEFGLGVTARSGMLDQAGTFPEADVPALVLLDANGSAPVGRWLSVYATATNLLGSTAITSWRPYGARPTAPFQVMVGVKARDGQRN